MIYIKIHTRMEIQTDLASPQVKDDIKIPTPMELQTDLESPQSQDDIYQNLHPIKLTWSVDKVWMVSNLHPHGTLN